MIYNKKGFLLPQSPWSMASYHAMIEPEKIAHFRIHDCQRGIHLWNDLNQPEQVEESINKLRSLAAVALEFADFIELNYTPL